MKLYRLSPIQNENQLLEAITYVHFSCYRLCQRSFGNYLANAGNIGIFCHYDDEFTKLKQIRGDLCEPTDNPELKYFTLLKPIVMAAKDGIPEIIYTHLYIRKPDPYRSHVGDIDFILDQEEYIELKRAMVNGKPVEGARVFERPDLDMIELYHPDIDVLAYVSANTATERVCINLSDATKP
jgi:hypothetical protein